MRMTPTESEIAGRLDPLRHQGAPGTLSDRPPVLSCDDPFVFLEHARPLAAFGEWDAAAAHLRHALSLHPPYMFFARARQLLDSMCRETPPSARQARIAVLGSSTTGLMVPIIRALAFRDGIATELYEGLHGAFRQEILSNDSGLARFRPDIAIVATHHRDLNLPPVAGDEAVLLDRVVEDYRTLWRALTDRFGCHVIQHGFDRPLNQGDGSLERLIRLLNRRLEAEAPSFVSVLDTDRVIADVGLKIWDHPALWEMARQHPSPDALPALCEEQLAHVRAVLGLTRKVLVCDLDNTLWGGVIAEDGLDGIRIGAGAADGECYEQLQHYVRALKDRGVLLAVCSKNDIADAQLPFTKHERMVLRLGDFVAFVANWDDKATNLERIAQTLRLGLESFVVLDDNPLERAWIRRHLPQVAVVEVGPSPSTYVRELDRGRYFTSLTCSSEDRTRTQRYRQAAAAESARAHAATLETFLQSLQMRGTCRPIAPDNVARVVQLTNKTNQFNLTTKRYTDGQIARLCSTPGAWSGVFGLSDCYGDHGTIGLLVAVPTDTPATWAIDTWLMSCRVLGRRFEEFMADRLVAAAREGGIARLVGTYRPTGKNGIVADLYTRLGFARAGEEGQFALDVASVTRPFGEFIQHVVVAAVS
jgi:FkbH-like protein